MSVRKKTVSEKNRIKCVRRGRTYTALGMCAEADGKTPVITITGAGFVKIKHHRGILLFTENRVKLCSEIGLITIEGKSLASSVMTGDELLLDRSIESVSIGQI